LNGSIADEDQLQAKAVRVAPSAPFDGGRDRD
jgi:hypothetical protein